MKNTNKENKKPPMNEFLFDLAMISLFLIIIAIPIFIGLGIYNIVILIFNIII